MDLGERIQELRTKRSLTQDELGDLIGMKRTNIANYESGRNVPPVDVLTKIADIFKVSIDFLIGRTEDPYQIYVNEEINNLSKEDQILYKKFMKETEDLLRVEGKLDEEKLRIAMKMMRFTFLEDVAEERRNKKE